MIKTDQVRLASSLEYFAHRSCFLEPATCCEALVAVLLELGHNSPSSKGLPSQLGCLEIYYVYLVMYLVKVYVIITGLFLRSDTITEV